MINLQNSLVLIKSRGERKDIGTGFVIYRDKSASYIVTCAHVVKAVGGKENVKVKGKDATVIAYGWELGEDSLDLAVIRVEGLDLPSLNLQPDAREKDSFSTEGFFYFDQGTTTEIREVNGTLKRAKKLAIREGEDFIKGWELEITSENLLKEGYSGSPILNQQQQVIGVVTHLLENGKKGAAISIDALAKCWLKMPSELLVDVKYPKLLKILTPYEKEISTYIKKAYQACRPDDWPNPLPNSLNKILADLEEIPKGDSQYTKIEQFVACLVADTEIPLAVSQPLTAWANQYIKKFDALLNQQRQNLDLRHQNRDSYLLVVLECRNQKSVINQTDIYGVKSWIIPDLQTYSYKNGYGCQQLNLEDSESKPDEKTFTIDEIPQVLKGYLEKSYEKYCWENLMIEIFIPLDILNHAVDRWVLDEEFGFSTSIGQNYRVVVRSYERLRKNYNLRRVSWKSKWDALQKITETSVCSAFLLGDCDNVNDVVAKLKSPKVIGLKLATAPVKIGKGSILATILESAIPVALWLRQNLPGLDCQSEIDRILDCCIHNLPETVKNKRSDAPLDANNHIGHHLSLLWEDPYRLPPDTETNYSM